MKATFTIFKKELKSYFSSPIAYIILVVFLVLSGLFFFLYLQSFVSSQFDPRLQFLGQRLNLNDFVIRPYFGTISIVLLLMIPVITMRLIAEERKNSTIELLFTSPVRILYIILGKFLASLYLFIIMIVLSAIYMVVLKVYGNPDLGPLLSGYLGLFLLGASFLSIGLFASSLTENQIVAALISFGLLLVFWIIGAVSDAESSILGYLSIINHFDNFSKGVIELKDVVYYLSFILFGIFLTYIKVQSERWK
ncbi:MAG TPA: ABC transporter permease [Thermodesulfobacteriota bacterium]|nr:ABC transporter permease [Thermodesulfobacteriota bacterium]